LDLDLVAFGVFSLLMVQGSESPPGAGFTRNISAVNDSIGLGSGSYAFGEIGFVYGCILSVFPSIPPPLLESYAVG
jgi:hypothetical protein